MKKKSIYEEALEIIDRNIFEIPGGFAVLYEIRKKIEQALKQSQKQEKLLELYRKLSVIRNDLLSYCEVIDDDYDDFEYIEIDLEKKIKELEKWN